MSFKEQIERDIDDVFLNLDEFGETHRVEGKEINVVVDDDTLEKLAKVGDNRSLGMVEADMILMAKESDLPKDLEPGRLINVDGREMIIVNTNKHMGLVELALRQNRSR